MYNFNIKVTDSAKEKIKDILIEENKENASLRVAVQGGGCAGFTYQFTISDDLDLEDFKINIDDSVSVVVDSFSSQYLEGAEIDYKDELFNRQFVINNPNAISTCGCGTSFSPRT